MGLRRRGPAYTLRPLRPRPKVRAFAWPASYTSVVLVNWRPVAAWSQQPPCPPTPAVPPSPKLELPAPASPPDPQPSRVDAPIKKIDSTNIVRCMASSRESCTCAQASWQRFYLGAARSGYLTQLGMAITTSIRRCRKGPLPSSVSPSCPLPSSIPSSDPPPSMVPEMGWRAPGPFTTVRGPSATVRLVASEHPKALSPRRGQSRSKGRIGRPSGLPHEARLSQSGHNHVTA
jgi:hypothetical protein